MSDAPHGPDWFRAADGRWYPPQGPPPGYGSPPPGYPPQGPPPGYGPPPPGYGGYPPVPPKSNATAWVIGCLVAPLLVGVIAVILIAAVTLLGRNASSKFSSVGTAVGGPSPTATPVSPRAPAGHTVTGATPCPPVDGSATRTTSFAQAPPMCIDPTKTYTATVVTTKGTFAITLDAKQAPLAVNNFVTLARYYFYDGTAFHRVIPGFVVQGGDATGSPPGTGGPGYEFADELPSDASVYQPGVVAMANAGPDTNGSQFYIVLEPNKLEAKYSVLGSVTEGFGTTVKAIEQGGSASGTPLDPTTITSVTITES